MPNASEGTSRSYSSQLRDEQAAATRERIVQALVEIIDSENRSDVSIPDVARRARVSIPTVYRHFPTKDDLFRAASSQSYAEFMGGLEPGDPAELAESLRPLFRRAAEREPLVRAGVASQAGATLRSLHRDERLALVQRALAPVTTDLDAEQARMLEAVVQLLSSPIAWMHMKDYFGFTPAQAARACGWAIQTLAASSEAESSAPAKRTTARKQKGRAHGSGR